MDRAAVILIAIAVLYCMRDRLPFPLFQLPGDLYFNDGRWSLVLPVTSMALISLAASFLMNCLRGR